MRKQEEPGAWEPCCFPNGKQEKETTVPSLCACNDNSWSLVESFFFIFQLYFSLSFNWIYYNTFFFFNILFFWPWGMWDLSSRTRDWTCTPCMGRQSLNHCTAGKPLFWIFNPLQNRSIIPFGINEKKQISSKLWQFSLLPSQLDWSFLIFRWY